MILQFSENVTTFSICLVFTPLFADLVPFNALRGSCTYIWCIQLPSPPLPHSHDNRHERKSGPTKDEGKEHIPTLVRRRDQSSEGWPHTPEIHDAGTNRRTHGLPLMYGARNLIHRFVRLEPEDLLTDPFVLDSTVANNFWGKEDAGVQPMLERMHAAKQTCDELRSFYNSKAPKIPSPEICPTARR